MTDKSKLWIPSMCELLADVEKETFDQLGDEKAGFFMNAWNDWLTIEAGITDTYPTNERFNLVYHVFTGLSKELYWYHFLFVAGNYPILNGRFRLAWEAVFRSYFAETYQGADGRGCAMEQKLDWLENRQPRLNWVSCIEPMLLKLFPLAKREKEVLDHYRARWQRLNGYVHPSAYLSSRLIDESALYVRDGFDKEWALDTISMAVNVLDLIWLAVLMFHERAIPRVAEKKLRAGYPIVDMLLEPVEHA